MWYRILNVKLEQFRVGRDQMVWFPVHGEHESFATGDRFLTEPVSRETYDVVRGSLVFNQDLPDARFSLDWDERKSSELDPWRREFREEQSHAKPKPAPRTDPAGVEQDLNQRLAEADEQARRLEATPPSRRIWNNTTRAQAGIAILSIGALAATILIKRRQRG